MYKLLSWRRFILLLEFQLWKIQANRQYLTCAFTNACVILLLSDKLIKWAISTNTCILLLVFFIVNLSFISNIRPKGFSCLLLYISSESMVMVKMSLALISKWHMSRLLLISIFFKAFKKLNHFGITSSIIKQQT